MASQMMTIRSLIQKRDQTALAARVAARELKRYEPRAVRHEAKGRARWLVGIPKGKRTPLDVLVYIQNVLVQEIKLAITTQNGSRLGVVKAPRPDLSHDEARTFYAQRTVELKTMDADMMVVDVPTAALQSIYAAYLKTRTEPGEYYE